MVKNSNYYLIFYYFFLVINCLQIVIPIMIKQKNGSIVSISSDAGRIGEYREAVYSACKAGIIALTKVLIIYILIIIFL